ncbi:PLP-dependent transferase [Gloeophyllum trabeum ATCC 11539]|uniref:PLP-dependent transferase n=1 Tax=Gloeophyllum trabeum (strain ATCC 11539 / FP-39264 / Madison 617) TaxID=670483 RepID=S7RF59_GLOTA|nr:PLP-dependent transferase [Gloeophyllum trabeum ATCC 11539]EPQ51134.1 PLP-dependent transferase [Gloeophyllum trabeum ATCC 11539]
MASELAFHLAPNNLSTRTPPIGQALSWAKQYVPAPDRPLLDISQGVPGTPPPPVLRDALAAAASAPGVFGYGPDEGEYELRKAVAEEMRWTYGGQDKGSGEVDVNAEDISITSGCNLAFVAVAMSLAQQGDEFILPVPWYFNNQMTLSLLGIKTVELQTYAHDHFLPDPERCAALITPRTRAIVLVTPNNPTGATYPPSLIASFASLARTHKIALIIDETYRDFIASSPPHYLFHSPSSRQIAPEHQPTDWSWRPTVISLYSFSKSYCIPGHRLGAITASPALLPALVRVFDCLQICAPRGAQRAFLTKPSPSAKSLLPSLRHFIKDNRDALAARHKLFRELLPRRWKIASSGAYYAFVRHPWKGRGAREVCERLARERGVVCLPVAFFVAEQGGEGETEVREEDRYVRFSVANVDDERIRTVCERLKEAEEVFGWELD